MSGGEEHPKGILKHVDTDEKKGKKFQWDENNIMDTYHPENKTYGHMKVDEPSTPYNFEYSASQEICQTISPEVLANKLTDILAGPPKIFEDIKHDADATLTPEEAEHRRNFQERRKRHYNEYTAVLALRRSHGHLAEEDDDSDEYCMDPVALQNARLNSQGGNFSIDPE